MFGNFHPKAWNALLYYIFVIFWKKDRDASILMNDYKIIIQHN